MAQLKLVNGLPIMQAAVDASTYLSTGLTANTPISLPGSNSFIDSNAEDIIIIVNDTIREITRDFATVGTTPFTQIQFNYALPNDAVFRVKKNI